MGRSRIQINIALSDEEYALFKIVKEKIGVPSDYGAVKKILMNSMATLFSGSGGKPFAEQFQKAPDFDEQIQLMKSSLNSRAKKITKDIENLKDQRDTIMSSGHYNPSFPHEKGEPLAKDEGDAIKRIDEKREFKALELALVHTTLGNVERLEHKDYLHQINNMRDKLNGRYLLTEDQMNAKIEP